MKLSDALQWLGTSFLMAMYIIMSFFGDYHTLQLMFGCLGGLCYLTWTVLVKNKPQMIVNFMGVAITAVGLLKAWG